MDRSQVDGPWPLSHPLPLPTWAPYGQQPYKTPTVWQYEELATTIELQVQKVLEAHNYNTVGNFLELYQGFRKSECSRLVDFFQRYAPQISASHHTCVGLALELWRRLVNLDHRFPGFSNNIFLVSCEESIESLAGYAGLGDRLDTVADTLEKEHVLLALKIDIAGRPGILLCDPGYHVGRVITIMEDRAYPHTGYFTQTDDPDLRREYQYSFSPINTKYVEWTERLTRNGIQKTQTALIYVSRPYLTAVDVTERRNLVYNFRSLLSRDAKGHLVAGFYFKVDGNTDDFTIFYQDRGRQRLKLNFSTFLHSAQINEDTRHLVSECNRQLNLPENELMNILSSLATILNDKDYLRQLLAINQDINEMAEDN